jgi:hypothetical protein
MEPSFLSTITARMVFMLRKAWRTLRSCLLCGCGRLGNRYKPLDQRLQRERDEFAEAKGKLENEIQKLNIKVS